jgi:hypothetical protein
MRTTWRRLAVIVAVVVALPFWAAATAGPSSAKKPVPPEPENAFELEMYLDGYNEHVGYEGFVIDAYGAAVDNGVMCASAGELSRTDASTNRKLQLWVLLACEPYTPWYDIPNCETTAGPCTTPSDLCHLDEAEFPGYVPHCFSLKLQGKPTAGATISWILYGGYDGTGKGEVVGPDHYRLWGELK